MDFAIKHGDCLDWLPRLQPQLLTWCLSTCLTALRRTHGIKPIPFGPMWELVQRAAKENAAIVFTATQPFAACLVCSNLKEFRYDLVWAKNKPTGFLNANRQPLRSHEHILVSIEPSRPITLKKHRGTNRDTRRFAPRKVQITEIR